MNARYTPGAILAVVAVGCVGSIGDNGTPEGPVISKEAEREVAVSGLRRLSVAEYRQTVWDLLGVEATAANEVLPSDTLTPFDNDYTLQTASEQLVKGAELLAGDVALAVLGSPELRSQLVGCEPSSVAGDGSSPSTSDAGCFASFVSSFGRRALRRPLSATEVERFTSLSTFGVEEGDFWVGVGAALRAFLQHPEFVYRVEIGTPLPGKPVHRLGPFEVAARLSYFLLGSTPPDWLLDAAEEGDLDTADGIAVAAGELFADERARARVNRFHAMWLSYDKLSREGLFGAMHDETNALVERIVFEEKRPWVEVLTSNETFITAELAEHYGLPSPGSTADWVDYGDSGRLGLLSQGTFLSAVPKFGDTSPTQRGLLVRTRLFCETIPKPPANLKVNVDMPPQTADPDACKQERYYMSTDPICSSCHKLMDPIGFGLENYGATGQFRETEPNRPDCIIDGDGNFVGMGTFNGPAELAQLAVESGAVESCVATQLYRFAVGRAELDEYNHALIERVVSQSSSDGGLDLEAFITSYVTSEAFVFRREEVAK